MDRGEFDNRKRIGSVKAALNLYGERILEANSPLKKPQMDFSAEPSPRKREVILTRRDVGRVNKSRSDTESLKAGAESELVDVKKTVRDLSSRIEESNSRAKMQIQDLEKLKTPKRHEENWGLALKDVEKYQYAEVMKELEYIKQELDKLKLDMASVLDDKRRAEKETQASSSKMHSYSSSVEAIKKELEELNEEQVLVELARIEALKECGAIEAHRKAEEKQYSAAIEETRKKVNGIIQEIDSAKDLETKLATTTSDVNMLHRELALVHEMDKSIPKNESLKHSRAGKGCESDAPSLLQSVLEELEAAKKELVSITEEGFQFMASMDIIGDELKHVSEETARLRKTEDKAELTVQNLNSKLQRAKAKLESVSKAEEEAKSIVSTLSLTLQQLKTEAEAAKKERELIAEETMKIKEEVPKTESDIDLAEERLKAAMQELEAVKSSEAITLENLKSLIENTMRARASASQHNSTITISTFEHEYLTGRAARAEEIADKKVAAAQAWIEALKASEKEILMKTEIAHRETRELRVEEEHDVYKTERSLSAKGVVEGEFWDLVQKRENNSEPKKSEPENSELEVALPRKIKSRNRNATPVRRAKSQRSVPPAARHMPRSTSSTTVKRRKEEMPNITKFFRSKSNERVR